MTRAVLHCAVLAGYEVQAIESDLRKVSKHYIDGRVVEEFKPYERNLPLPEFQQKELDEAFATVVDADAPTLMIQLPGNFSDPRWREFANGPMLGWTMTESDNLCPYWQFGIRHLDMVIAPTSYVRDTFQRVLPDVTSTRLPIPVDERLWSPDEYREQISNERPPFLFYSMFTMQERKQWRVMMQAFAEEFCKESDKVGLVVKPTNGGPVAEMAGWCREMGAWVVVDHEERTDWTLGAMYRACDVYVQVASEGQGLTYIEAGLCGKPSIALDKSGSVDVVSDLNGYLVPSQMKPLIGHMPMWYPRTHNFAQCDIDDLRLVMRQAYERESSGNRKGGAALMSAREFTCEAIAPQLRRTIERGAEAHEHRKMYPSATKPSTAVVAGAWGDVFCACGKVVEMLNSYSMDEIDIIYYGRDPKITDWLGRQTWCRKVIPMIESSVDEMTKQYAMACQVRAYHSREWLSDMLDKYGHHVGFAGPTDVALTQLRLNEFEQPKFWKNPRLSPDARLWAHEVAAEVGSPFYVLNPLSIASNKMRDHWRFWNDAIVWLLDDARCGNAVFVLVGEKPIDWPDHPRLRNYAGQSKSMEDVLALAEESLGVITTSNNLGIYTPLAEIPAVVVCARTCGPETFYHRWYTNDDTYLVEWLDAMNQFTDACEALFSRCVTSSHHGRETAEMAVAT